MNSHILCGSWHSLLHVNGFVGSLCLFQPLGLQALLKAEGRADKREATVERDTQLLWMAWKGSVLAERMWMWWRGQKREREQIYKYSLGQRKGRRGYQAMEKSWSKPFYVYLWYDLRAGCGVISLTTLFKPSGKCWTLYVPENYFPFHKAF